MLPPVILYLMVGAAKKENSEENIKDKFFKTFLRTLFICFDFFSEHIQPSHSRLNGESEKKLKNKIEQNKEVTNNNLKWHPMNSNKKIVEKEYEREKKENKIKSKVQ